MIAEDRRLVGWLESKPMKCLEMLCQLLLAPWKLSVLSVVGMQSMLRKQHQVSDGFCRGNAWAGLPNNISTELIDICNAYREVDTVKIALHEVHDNINAHHKKWSDSAVAKVDASPSSTVFHVDVFTKC